MFITDDEASLIEVKIFYKKQKYKYLAYSEANFNKLELTEDEKKKYSQLNIKMRDLSWGMYNDLQESALESDATGNRHFNFKNLKENKLVKLIKSWDAKDQNSRPIAINANTIRNLSPYIAEVILTTYDTLTTLDEETEKN